VFFLKELPSLQMVEGYASRLEDFDADEVLRALRIMRDGSLLIRELEAYFARHELSQLRFLAMIVIDREPDRDSLTAGEIAERLDVSRPVVTRTLQGLEKAGLIAISSNARDARARDVALTPAGHATLDEVLPGYFAIFHDTMKGIRA
jgi:DNA-binding MarR family transcriptional regulator